MKIIGNTEGAGIVLGILVCCFILVKAIKRCLFVIERNFQYEIEYADITKDIFPGDKGSNALFRKGIDYVVLKRPKKALPIFEKLLRKAKTIHELYAVNFLIADCYMIQERYEETITLCRDIINMDAERIYAWHQIGVAYLMLEKYEDAMDALEHAEALLSAMPENAAAAEVYAVQASVYVCLEDFVEAKKYIDLAYQRNRNRDIISMKELIEEALVSPVKEMDGVEVTPLFQRMAEDVGYPCRVIPGAETPLDEITKIYRQSLQRGKEKGFVPILVGEGVLSAGIERWKDATDLPYGQYIKSTIAQIGPLEDGKEIANRRFREMTECEGFDLEELTGSVAGGDRYDSFQWGMDETLILFEVPVQNPWEVLLAVPGILWQEREEQREILAICRYWYEKYHAVPAASWLYAIEFVLPEPVPEKEALEVAKEIYAFFDETAAIETESGKLGELADSIRKSTVWTVWTE